MDEHILTTLKILIIGESGVGKSRLVQVQFILFMCGHWRLHLDGLSVNDTCYSDEYCFISFVFIVCCCGSSMITLIPARP
jgi:ABC-type siderophore export system fused ATPase/permease subunit